MKKILSFALVFVFLFSTFTVTAHAQTIPERSQNIKLGDTVQESMGHPHSFTNEHIYAVNVTEKGRLSISLSLEGRGDHVYPNMRVYIVKPH